MFFDVSRVRQRVTLVWGRSELSSEEFYLRVGGRRNLCMVQIIFMELGGTKRWGFKVAIWWQEAQRTTIFY